MRVAVLSVPWLAGAMIAAIAGPASAGCSAGCASCCLPSTHTVIIPGVTVTPPTVIIAAPLVTIAGGVGAAGLEVSVSTAVDGSSQAQTSSQATSTSNVSSSAGAVSSGAVANLVSGGGAVFADVGGPSTNFGPINVEVAPVAAGAPICLDWRSTARLVAVEASCLDDKAVPHPASQVSPERDVAAGYQGEVFRCIAGSHMQFSVGEWNGAARFDGARTVVCGKNEALWRDAAGGLACRVQKPARDCNERSLLRRYGAGIKLVSSATRTCASWGDRRNVAQQDGGGVLGAGFGGEGGVGH